MQMIWRKGSLETEQFFIFNILRGSFFIFSLSQNPIGLKLSQLLSQFLYQTRKLDLPGIGTFTLDAAAVIPGEAERGGAPQAAGITFKNAIIRTPDDALIGFIKEHTGKMKPLAAADLDFFLTTGKQLLNIGKPFYLEGIGMLMQNKQGLLDFVPGEYMIARLDEPGNAKKDRSDKKTAGFDEPAREYEPAKSNNVRQGLLLAGIIVGLIIIGWGGYYLYKKNTYVEPVAETKTTVIPDTTATHDSTAATTRGGQQLTTDSTVSKKPDSSPRPVAPATAAAQPPTTPQSTTPQPVTPQPANPQQANPQPTAGQNIYRFVILETANKNRALRRYNQLLGYQLNIKMDQKDSSFFKLYFPIPAGIRDTTHIRDSLADVYAAHVRIEQ
jgi:hypothetical protein